jgi:hypothetical protein
VRAKVVEVRIMAPARLTVLKAFIKRGSGCEVLVGFASRRGEENLGARGVVHGKQIILFFALTVPIVSSSLYFP